MVLRQKIFLERVRKRLTIGVMLTDNIGSDKKAIGYVFIEAPGVKREIIKHKTGYFLFIDFPEGNYNLTAGGEYYQQKDFEVDTSTLQPDQPLVDILLDPKANYPFPDGMTVLKGKIVDTDYKPIFEASISIEGMNESSISEDMGDFFIQFDTIDEDKDITININKEGYEVKQVPVLLKKDTTTRVGTIELTEL